MIEPAVIPVSGSAAIPVTGHVAILTGTPRLFGAVHLTLSAAAVLLAVFCALRAKRLSAAGRLRLISMCGWGLVVLEAYKQLFLFFVVNGRHYDWWFFPFQLCSVPMYMCILMPLLCGKLYKGGYGSWPVPGVRHVAALGSDPGSEPESVRQLPESHRQQPQTLRRKPDNDTFS